MTADPRPALLAHLAESERLARASTGGAWEVGHRWMIAGCLSEDGCAVCHLGAPDWTGRLDINGTVMPAHVHRRDEVYGTDITSYDGAGTLLEVTSSNDWGPGIERADAEHVVRWQPATVLVHVAAVRSLVEVHGPREHRDLSPLTCPDMDHHYDREDVFPPGHSEDCFDYTPLCNGCGSTYLMHPTCPTVVFADALTPGWRSE